MNGDERTAEPRRAGFTKSDSDSLAGGTRGQTRPDFDQRSDNGGAKAGGRFGGQRAAGAGTGGGDRAHKGRPVARGARRELAIASPGRVYLAAQNQKHWAGKSRRTISKSRTFTMPTRAKIPSVAIGECQPDNLAPDDLAQHLDVAMLSNQKRLMIAPSLLNSGETLSFSLLVSETMESPRGCTLKWRFCNSRPAVSETSTTTGSGLRYYACRYMKFGAGDGGRTRDVQLGKLAFYH
jgi:hypothetical protein